ncbi:MAG: protein-glutamate O-methyltransferase CheR [Myxococcota bacterium]
MTTATATASLELKVDDRAFRRLASVVEQHLGIRLPDEKRPLVVRRMRSLVLSSGARDLGEWVDRHLQRAPTPALLSELADALTTNHTFFWREPDHFEHLRDHALRDRLAAKAQQRDLRVWCAAAATGEEPYQLAMILRDGVPAGWQAGLLATDVSAKALQAARAGRYPADRLEGLPKPWHRWVALDADGGHGTIRDELRRDVTFRRLNLVRDRWPFRAPFDIVFCRNVLIYFDPPVRDKVVGGIVSQLAVGGYLYVGHSESVPAGKWPLAGVASGVWRKVG